MLCSRKFAGEAQHNDCPITNITRSPMPHPLPFHPLDFVSPGQSPLQCTAQASPHANAHLNVPALPMAETVDHQGENVMGHSSPAPNAPECLHHSARGLRRHPYYSLGDGNFVKRSLSEKQQCLVNKSVRDQGRGPLASLRQKGFCATVPKTHPSSISHPRIERQRTAKVASCTARDGMAVKSASCVGSLLEKERIRLDKFAAMPCISCSQRPPRRLEESPVHQAPLAFTRIPDLLAC